jgi:hypothetical protein
MRRKGSVDGRDHVVLVLLVGVVVVHAVRVAWLHVCLHGEQGAVWRKLGTVWDVHATKVASTAAVVPVHDMAVGQDVGKGAFLAELAVALKSPMLAWNCSIENELSDLGKILAGRALSQRLVGMQKRACLSSLAGALPVEFARHM